MSSSPRATDLWYLTKPLILPVSHQLLYSINNCFSYIYAISSIEIIDVVLYLYICNRSHQTRYNKVIDLYKLFEINLLLLFAFCLRTKSVLMLHNINSLLQWIKYNWWILVKYHRYSFVQYGWIMRNLSSCLL